jgi:nucleoside-diphosphate-sugar epimerase
MRMLIFGLGFTGARLARAVVARGGTVVATQRSAKPAPAGVDVIHPDQARQALESCTHLVVTTPPHDGVCPALTALAPDGVLHAPHLQWLGYLSTTGVYGDHAGGWVDEDTPATPQSPEAAARVRAEAGWQAAAYARTSAMFRLPGIYGPGRSALDRVMAPGARATVKPGQVFSRIHADDIVQTVLASCDAPRIGAIYNVADDEPMPPEAALDLACDLLGVPHLPRVAWDAPGQSPSMARFYAECKRVRNDRIKTELGVQLRYPTLGDGLRAILSAAESF